MTGWKEMVTGTRSAVAVGAAVVVAVIGWLVWPTAPDLPPPAPVAVAPVLAPTPAPEAQPAPAPAPAVAAAPEPAPTPEPTVAAAPEVVAAAPEPAPVAAAPAPPTFDTVRVDGDGAALVAGRAEAGAAVSILVDGVEAATAAADPRGSFAALFTLPPSQSPRLLTLAETLSDGTVVASSESVALAPVAAPLVVTEPEAVATAPEPAPEPAAEPAAPTALLLTDSGAQVLQSGEPAVATADAVSIDSISYTADGSVQLAGRGQGGAVVRLYLDNADLASVTISDADTWAVTLPEVAPGIYTLRADQLDAAGQVTARFETPFKRETLEALAAVATPAAVAATPEPAPAAVEPAVAPTSAPAAAAATLEPAPAAAEPVAAPIPAPAEVAAPVAPAPIAVEPATAPTPAPAAIEPVAAPAPAPAEVAATPEPAPVDTAPTPAAAAPIVAAAAPEAAPQPAAPPPPLTVTVQPGFTLWRIARENFGEGIMYVQVFEANRDKIRDPDLIYPGQVFTIPAPAN